MEKKVYVSNKPDISMSELKKLFPYICADRLQYEVDNNEYVTLRGFLRYMQGINDRYKQRAEVPDCVQLDIRIEWKRSQTWGHNPHASYRAKMADGSYISGTAKASGCGYDKESTVVADAYNAVLSGMAWRKRKTKQKPPYGLCLDGWFPYFDGGIGMSSYRSITEFLGGTLEHVTDERAFDHWRATFPQKKNVKS